MSKRKLISSRLAPRAALALMIFGLFFPPVTTRQTYADVKFHDRTAGPAHFPLLTAKVDVCCRLGEDSRGKKIYFREGTIICASHRQYQCVRDGGWLPLSSSCDGHGIRILKGSKCE